MSLKGLNVTGLMTQKRREDRRPGSDAATGERIDTQEHSDDELDLKAINQVHQTAKQ